MEIDPTRMCELLVGLLDVDVLGVEDPVAGHLVVKVAVREDTPSCGRCGTRAWVKDHRDVDLVDLPAFDQTVTLRVARARIVVFVDGCFWHRCPDQGNEPRANTAYWRPKLDRNVERDLQTDARLSAAGWTVLRVWEHEEPTSSADRIAQVMRGEPGRV